MHTTAILFFTRSRTKQLGPTERSSELIHQSMQAHTADVLAQSGLPVIRWDESNQQGRHFAERLCHALITHFAAGWQHLIVVGDDCPKLTTTDLLAAYTTLEAGNQVIGPDRDGGAYLIGLSAAAFDATTFAGLPWQTDTLLDALQRWMSQDSPLTILRTHADVDTMQQVIRLLSSASLPVKLRLLWTQWLVLSRDTLFQLSTYNYLPHHPSEGRAPPLAT